MHDHTKIARGPISEYLEQFRGKQFYYMPNPGNAGDSLIAAATYQLFDDLKFDYKVPNSLETTFAGETVLYGGGGNLVRQGSYSYKFLRNVHRGAQRLVILPHTIKNVAPLLREFESNVDIICREKYSYEYALEHATRANVMLMHDMALCYDLKRARFPSPFWCLSVQWCRYVLANVTGRLSIDLKALQRLATRRHAIAKAIGHIAGPDIYCFRRDGEATDVIPPESNEDLSLVCRYGTLSRNLAELGAGDLVNILSGFETVHTNRLHLGIGAALCGLDVRLYPNNYFKNQGVFEFSLKNLFSNVDWVDQRSQALVKI